jgi:predicted nucleic acid-binding protein
MIGKLLDSTVLIDLSRGDVNAADYIDHERNANVSLFVSVISAMELVVGCRNKEEVQKTQRLIGEFTLLHLSPKTSALAYELIQEFSKSNGLAIPDALIAATALVNNLELASDNVRHFAMIPQLVVNRPY